MMFLRYLLFPVSLLYAFVSRVRNVLFDKQWFLKSEKSVFPTICVGNLTVGGTGKTPHVEYLIGELSDEKNVVTLSRGYGRKTKGFILADETASATTIGDEPFQIYSKFKNVISVCVGEDRVASAKKIEEKKPDTDLLILDDAFQHRYIKADCNILLTDYKRLFFNDVMLPTGNLREVRSGADRADVIVVTKCDKNITKKEQQEIVENIHKYNNKIKIYFSYISYNKLFMVNDVNNSIKYVSVSGIAQNEMFHTYCRATYNTIKSYSFRDHKGYTVGDFQSIVEFCETNDAVLVVTEKDYVKLQGSELRQLLSRISWGYVPIKVNFVPTQQNSFIDEVKRYI